MICQVPVFIIIAVYIDDRMTNSFKGTDASQVTVVNRLQLDEREDVIRHREFSHGIWDSSRHQDQDYLIQGKNLYKVYKNGTAAINNNSFSIKQGEVFGLLGPNGAGKSSMFNVMTMDLQRTSGDVKILKTDLDEINVGSQGNQMGMCPQHNTIWGVLTVD